MTRNRFWRSAAAVLALGLLAAACGSDEDNSAPVTTPAEEPGTIVEVAVANGSFTTLVAAIEAAGLVDTLSGEGPFTVFAPTDDAFAALPEGTLDGLLADTDALTSVLTYHVVAGEVPAADVVGLSEATTLNGAAVPITVDGDTVMVGDATVVLTDVAASNGIIHVIDTVLVP